MTRAVSTTAAQAAVMQQTASHFDDAKGNLDTTLKHLMGHLDALLAHGWTGAAANAFSNSRMQWGDDQTNLNNNLGATAQMLRDAAATYTTTDDSGAGRFGGGGDRVAI